MWCHLVAWCNLWGSWLLCIRQFHQHTWFCTILKYMSGSLLISVHTIQWILQTKNTLGTGQFSLVESLSSSQRFSFKPIGNFLKTKNIIIMYSASFLMVFLIARWQEQHYYYANDAYIKDHRFGSRMRRYRCRHSVYVPACNCSAAFKQP